MPVTHGHGFESQVAAPHQSPEVHTSGLLFSPGDEPLGIFPDLPAGSRLRNTSHPFLSFTPTVVNSNFVLRYHRDAPFRIVGIDMPNFFPCGNGGAV